MEPHQTSVRARKGAAGALGVSPKASPKVATSPLPDVKGGDASKVRLDTLPSLGELKSSKLPPRGA